MKLKRILLLLIIAVTIIAFSGCTNVTCTLNLNQDGKIDVVASVLYSDKEFSYNNESIEKIKEEFEENGFSVNDINESGMIGFTVEKKDFDLNGFNKALSEEFNINLESDFADDFKFKKGFLYNVYDIDTNIDLSSFAKISSVKDGNGDLISGEELQKLLSHISLKLVVKLDKGTILKTNSVKVSADKKTAEWVLIPGTNSDIEFKAITTAVLPIIGTVIILGVIFILTVIFLIMLVKMYIKRRKECAK